MIPGMMRFRQHPGFAAWQVEAELSLDPAVTAVSCSGLCQQTSDSSCVTPTLSLSPSSLGLRSSHKQPKGLLMAPWRVVISQYSSGEPHMSHVHPWHGRGCTQLLTAALM